MPEVHPYNFVPSADDFITNLKDHQSTAGQYLDLSDTIALAERYRTLAETAASTEPADVEAYNLALLKVTRIVNPALFTIDGPYEMDPALQLPVLPGLAPMRELAALDPESSEHRFLWTQLIRQRNRIHDALLQACEVLEST